MLTNAERSAAAEAAFRARLGELGAELLEPYRTDRTPVRVRCAAGHERLASPRYVLKGGGVCRGCSRTDPANAEAAFRARAAELGIVILESQYLGARTPHRVLCVCGHESMVRPDDTRRGRGYCRACRPLAPGAVAKRHRAASKAEAAFRARIAELGGELLEPTWLGNDKPHRARCAAGHECAPRWTNLSQGDGMCPTCAGHDPRAAEAAFRERLEQLGATLLEPVWLGANTPHSVWCAAGHYCTPTPGNVSRGQGICPQCAGKVWDVFYVVADRLGGRIKFGITSGDPRPRLGAHRADGYRERVLVLEGLPGTVAPEIERAAIAALALAGIKPLRGREHYGAEALAVVLDVADHYPHPE
jgi:hypothetical protein